jgi:hypothetical protein
MEISEAPGGGHPLKAPIRLATVHTTVTSPWSREEIYADDADDADEAQ